MKNLLCFVTGAAIGSVVTWKLIEKKYKDLADEEIESVIETFKNRKPRITKDNVKETVEKLKKTSDVILVDFHAESSLEKESMGFFLDGSVSAVVGTHTHVQTLDEKILPKGTGYISDLGLTGVHSGVIGSKPEISIERQLTQLPMKSEISDEAGEIQGVLLTIDSESGKCVEIVRI